METISVKEPINLKVVRFELDFSKLVPEKPRPLKEAKSIRIPRIKCRKQSIVPLPPTINCSRKRDAKDLIEELLDELYTDQRYWCTSGTNYSRGSTSAASFTSSQSNYGEQTEAIERSYLESLGLDELHEQLLNWNDRLQQTGEQLAKCVKSRDRLHRQQRRLCAAFTVILRHIIRCETVDNAFNAICASVLTQMSAILNSLRNLAGSARTASAGESGVRFGVKPSGEGEGPGEGGYSEWLHAMRLVARLPAGVPQHFRKKLWLTLAERHLTSRGIDWSLAECACFRGTAQPDDTELGAQIIKDLHRTGCSLFCGTEGRENQAMLRRVLLAYARWNKEVGYCQGFNMLAAIILEVMDKSESESLKVMIYLVEAVLPEGYFADDLRGLSADMAAFRDLLRLRLPRLAHHMDYLQRISDGGGVEPPLPDVFTMQWFLTLYATWLPRESLLRIWDLVFLDGNEMLLLTALAIWDMLQDRILSARSADEFYSCMGGGAGAVWEAGDALVARVVTFGSAPELPKLRSLHRYRVAPPAPPASAPTYHPPLHSAMQTMTKKGLRLFYSEDEGDSSDDGNRMALATVVPRREDRLGTGDRLSLDIGALKRQYARLRERQRQAHVILAAACARHAAVGVPTSPTSLTVNNLLLGKSAIVSSRGRRLGPPPGAIPPSRQTTSSDKIEPQTRERSDETISWNEEKSRKKLSRRNSVKWKDLKKDKTLDRRRKASLDLEERGDGIIVSEIEANEMIASIRSRSSSETSTYSSHTASSTDTSLCDENERQSEEEQDLSDDDKEQRINNSMSKDFLRSPILNDTKLTHSPSIKKIMTKQSPDFNNYISTSSTNTSIKSISDYLDSAAGEPLRTYIDGFESKLIDNLTVNTNSDPYRPSSVSPRLSRLDKDKVLQRLNISKIKDGNKTTDFMRPTDFHQTPKIFTELSPIELSPCNYHKSPYEHNFVSTFECCNTLQNPDLRPPDIIDNFIMYPNFVPDIDLSEKNISDMESSPRSPGGDSIIVSEDEPPIPLKIDKYFEHSPEFFGARVTDPNSSEIPNRRSIKRLSRYPKKTDSLTLQGNHNDKSVKENSDRASSLPQNHNLTTKDCSENRDIFMDTKQDIYDDAKIMPEAVSPKDYVLRIGRKNSERALQIIQENSKILSRILTKQTLPDISHTIKDNYIKTTENVSVKQKQYFACIPENIVDHKLNDSPLLKESTSDSFIGNKLILRNESKEKKNFLRIRPISVDDPFSLDSRSVLLKKYDCSNSSENKSCESLGNRTDLYGWENKGFLAKRNHEIQVVSSENDKKNKSCDFLGHTEISTKLTTTTTSELNRRSFSGGSKISVTSPTSEIKDASTYGRQCTGDNYNYPFSSKYGDLVLPKPNDLLYNQNVDQVSTVYETIPKTEDSQVSDFAHVVTSSISFTYEPSMDDDSAGAKSNSSDTLCQITSLDQVSTPISPKYFPNRETPVIPKDNTEKSDKTKVESDDTCSAITSLIETDTLSSLSYPRSPSTGSYHPFPARPVMRVPKEIGVRLGMYSKDVLNSPSK